MYGSIAFAAIATSYYINRAVFRVTAWMKEMSAADEQKMKREVLCSSSVICTTLNHSGSNLLLEVFKRSANNGCKTAPFGCVIVDEVHCLRYFIHALATCGG